MHPKYMIVKEIRNNGTAYVPYWYKIPGVWESFSKTNAYKLGEHYHISHSSRAIAFFAQAKPPKPPKPLKQRQPKQPKQKQKPPPKPPPPRISVRISVRKQGKDL